LRIGKGEGSNAVIETLVLVTAARGGLAASGPFRHRRGKEKEESLAGKKVKTSP